MKSLYSKLILGFLATIMISFSFAGYFSIRQHTYNIKDLAYSYLVDVGEALVDEVQQGHIDTIANLAKASNTGIVLMYQGEQLIFGDGIEQADLEIMQQPWHNNKYHMSGNALLYHVPMNLDMQAYIKKSTTEEMVIFQQSAMLTLGGIFISGSLIFLIIADIIVKPIKRLTKATNALAQGKYDVQVHYYGHDELAALSKSFNLMAKRLVKVEENRQKFISDISHEFQTPLTSIQGFAKILTAEQVNDEQRRHYANIILDQSKRLSTLSKNMMQLTVLEGDDLQLEKTKFSLIEQLTSIVEMQSGLAKEHQVDIVTDFPKSEIMIHADRDRMEQVFINLINNAIKYTLEDGVVTVHVKRNLKDIEVSIEDTGIGMSAESLQHIFDRFYRADKSRSITGNGLGLSIVKRIIDLHGYEINVVSQLDVGSVFTIVIPSEVGLRVTKKTND